MYAAWEPWWPLSSSSPFSPYSCQSPPLLSTVTWPKLSTSLSAAPRILWARCMTAITTRPCFGQGWITSKWTSILSQSISKTTFLFSWLTSLHPTLVILKLLINPQVLHTAIRKSLIARTQTLQLLVLSLVHKLVLLNTRPNSMLSSAMWALKALRPTWFRPKWSITRQRGLAALHRLQVRYQTSILAHPMCRVWWMKWHLSPHQSAATSPASSLAWTR